MPLTGRDGSTPFSRTRKPPQSGGFCFVERFGRESVRAFVRQSVRQSEGPGPERHMAFCCFTAAKQFTRPSSRGSRGPTSSSDERRRDWLPPLARLSCHASIRTSISPIRYGLIILGDSENTLSAYKLRIFPPLSSFCSFRR